MNETSSQLTLVTGDRPSVGLVLSDDLTHEEFIAIGRQFNRAADLYAWCLGDWIAYGQRRFRWGDKYTDAMEATGIDYNQLRNYAVTARAVSIERRVPTLSYTHHVKVAALQPDEQTRWLKTAVTQRLDVRELAASVKEGRVMRVADIRAQHASNQGLHGPHAVWATFNRAYRDCTARVPFEKWTAETKRAWKEQLLPIAELYARL